MTNKQLQRKSTKWLQVLEDRSNINYLTVIDEQFAENELKEIFDYIDVNADGFISLIDLQMVLNELMPKLSEKDVAEMFAIVKKTDKTQICYEEFESTIASFFEDYQIDKDKELERMKKK